MDPRERIGDRIEALRIALDSRQASIHTGFPGIIVSVNMTAMTAVVQPAIQGQFQNLDGTWSNVNLPQLLDCPIFFPGGGDFVLTMPLAKDNEVWVNIAERCIDAWWQKGGVQPQAEIRMHDLSDGFCFPKIWSQPQVLSPPPSTVATQLRTKDGTAFLEIIPNPNGSGYMVRVQAAEIQLHATFRLKQDVNGYGQVITYVGGNVWQVDTYETPTPSQTVNSLSHNINPPEVPG